MNFDNPIDQNASHLLVDVLLYTHVMRWGQIIMLWFKQILRYTVSVFTNGLRVFNTTMINRVGMLFWNLNRLKVPKVADSLFNRQISNHLLTLIWIVGTSIIWIKVLDRIFYHVILILLLLQWKQSFLLFVKIWVPREHGVNRQLLQSWNNRRVLAFFITHRLIQSIDLFVITPIIVIHRFPLIAGAAWRSTIWDHHFSQILIRYSFLIS